MTKNYFLGKNSILFCVLLFAGTLFSIIYGSYLSKLNKSDLEFQIDLFSVDNLYNEKENRYNGEIISQSNLSYQIRKDLGNSYELSTQFVVKKATGEQIFSVDRIYGIDQTGKHLGGIGDQNREGYLYGPSGNMDSTFIYWHINYNQPIHMKLVGSESIYGLNVNKYQSYFVADQSKELSHLPGVPEARGIELDVYLELWIEPTLGRLIKYEDFATAWYYDGITKERLHPWNTFHNEIRTTSIVKEVAKTKARLLRIDIFSYYLPLVLFLLGFLIVFTGFPVVMAWLTAKSNIAISISLFALGIIITLLIANSINKSQELDEISQVETNSREIISSFQHELDLCTEALEFIRYQYLINDTLIKSSFEGTANRLIGRSNSITAISWLRKVPKDKRSLFEKSYLNGKAITEVQDGITLTKAGVKDFFFPVTYITPYESNKKAIGFDISSRLSTKKTIDYAELVNSPSCSPPIQLVQEENPNDRAVLIINPTRNGKGEFVGLVNGVVGIADLKNASLGNFTANFGVQLEIIDVTNSDHKFLLKNDGISNENSLIITKNLPIKGRIWKFNFVYPKPDYSLTSIFLIFGGILFSLIISYLIYRDLLRRGQKLEVAKIKLELYSEKLSIKNQELEQFIFVASHDLQEPTQSIRGFLNLLEEEEANTMSENGKSYLNYTKDEVSRMHSLVKALGDYIRIGKDRKREEVDMQTQAKLAMVSLKNQIESYYPKIVIDEMPSIKGVESELQIIWYHLVENAIKFRRNDSPLQINLGYEKGINNHLFYVKDNGIGIPKDQHDKVFEIFRSLHLREAYPGNGMGLSLCTKVLENHGGRIWVESEPGFGSTFFFSIPLYHIEEEA